MFNKKDLTEDAEKIAAETAEKTGYNGKYFIISASNRDGTDELVRYVEDLLEKMPREEQGGSGESTADDLRWDDDAGNEAPQADADEDIDGEYDPDDPEGESGSEEQ